MENLIKKISVPDLGGISEVDVIELLVKPGDRVTKEDGLITLESDKASMDVPSPWGGTIKDIKIKVGDTVKEGDEILTIELKKNENENIGQKEAKNNINKLRKKDLKKRNYKEILLQEKK
nr:biotin/lipoyl-containing protein [Coxiella endosymbiont of Rhipicephalus microplus]